MNILKLIGGIISLVTGILGIIFLIKNNIRKEDDMNKLMLQGYIGSFGFIIIGIILISNELKVLFN